jgi:predicted XRE-type DNA-binding protein
MFGPDGNPTAENLLGVIRALQDETGVRLEIRAVTGAAWGGQEMRKDNKVTASSGNVFADLGLANPEEELLKAKLVREIRGIIKRRKLTQAKAADTLGLKQPDVFALVTGRAGKFSIERLVRCLDRLDYTVDLVVRHKPRRAASRAIAA